MARSKSSRSRKRRKPAKKSRPKAARKAKASKRRKKSAAKRAGSRKKAAKKATRKAKAKARKPARKKTARKRTARKASRKPIRQAAPNLPPRTKPRPAARPTLDRARRTLTDAERLGSTTSTLVPRGTEDRLTSSARAGHEGYKHELERYNETGPRLTAGDLDARWQDAYAVGDEAPGGDNPTPDQDRVDDIGKALGINYQDDQELMGGDEVAERDKHRWELDPASSDDWPHDKGKDED